MKKIISHACGAVGIRLQRYRLKKAALPDLSFLKQNLAVGGVSSIESLSAHGIECILDLREENEDSQHEITKYGIEYKKIAIKDRFPPTHNQAKEAIDWINTKIKNKKVFVHCNLGRGRATSIAALYLINEGIVAHAAAWKNNNRHLPGSHTG